MNVEHGTFTPLVFSVNGGMSKECLAFHKNLADKIASKTEDRYKKIISVIRCKLLFLLLRSTMCVRGSRSVKMDTTAFDDFDLISDSVRL